MAQLCRGEAHYPAARPGIHTATARKRTGVGGRVVGDTARGTEDRQVEAGTAVAFGGRSDSRAAWRVETSETIRRSAGKECDHDLEVE